MKNCMVVCICGIDTGIGKTIVTGLLARAMLDRKISVITQKMVQTGCERESEDIIAHRQLMGIDLLAEDTNGTTCPYIFPIPCSPHLAAKQAGTVIDPAWISQATRRLAASHEAILLEAAGGLFVPLHGKYLILDYISEQRYPVILVSSSRLGSINHTLAMLEALKNREIQMAGLIYNRFAEENFLIGEDTRLVIGDFLKEYGFSCPVVDIFAQDDNRSQKNLADFVEHLTDFSQRTQ